MQLFILDTAPRLAAVMLCDKHLRKMCLETAQILSSVLYNKNMTVPPELPKPYNPRHPVIAAVNNAWKINWVLIYNSALQREYTYRFGKNHAYRKLVRVYMRLLYTADLNGADWSFARAFKEFDSPGTDIVKAYREYYRRKKLIMRNMVYTKRLPPDWLI